MLFKFFKFYKTASDTVLAKSNYVWCLHALFSTPWYQIQTHPEIRCLASAICLSIAASVMCLPDSTSMSASSTTSASSWSFPASAPSSWLMTWSAFSFHDQVPFVHAVSTWQESRLVTVTCITARWCVTCEMIRRIARRSPLPSKR